jgi:Cys-tRNA(Pro)/Cys-tRNA(Cys) deacylase
MPAFKKTNAMRMLDSSGIDYECKEYEFDENDLDGHHVAEYLGVPYEEVFKTLVAVTDKGEYLVYCLSVDDEVDLKKAAKLAGEKRVEMIHVKDLLAVTGYIRGGCSPIGMKKKYRTFIDEMIELVDSVSVSGGQRGLQITMNPKDLVSFTEAAVGDFAMRN